MKKEVKMCTYLQTADKQTSGKAIFNLFSKDSVMRPTVSKNVMIIYEYSTLYIFINTEFVSELLS
jgi:hypothetical protein